VCVCGHVGVGVQYNRRGKAKAGKRCNVPVAEARTAPQACVSAAQVGSACRSATARLVPARAVFTPARARANEAAAGKLRRARRRSARASVVSRSAVAMYTEWWYTDRNR